MSVCVAFQGSHAFRPVRVPDVGQHCAHCGRQGVHVEDAPVFAGNLV